VLEIGIWIFFLEKDAMGLKFVPVKSSAVSSEGGLDLPTS
jgi:hypothetical protein